MKFRKLPGNVDAMQYTDKNFKEVSEFTNGMLIKYGFNEDMQPSGRFTAPAIFIDGDYKQVRQYDWIVKDKGQIAIYSLSAFENTFIEVKKRGRKKKVRE